MSFAKLYVASQAPNLSAGSSEPLEFAAVDQRPLPATDASPAAPAAPTRSSRPDGWTSPTNPIAGSATALIAVGVLLVVLGLFAAGSLVPVALGVLSIFGAGILQVLGAKVA